MRRSYLILFSIFLLTGCFKGEVESIEDSANLFQAKIDGKSFELTRQKVCTFPNPCRIEGGFTNIYTFEDELRFSVEDVKNDYLFQVSLVVPDPDGQVGFNKDFELSRQEFPEENWGRIVLSTEEYIWVGIESGEQFRTRLRYILQTGNIGIDSFNPETFSYSGSFSGRFQLQKGGIVDQNGEYQEYIYPEGLVETMEITNGYFEITEPKWGAGEN